MRVIYYKNGSKHVVSQSNADITISEVREGNHTCIKLLASLMYLTHVISTLKIYISLTVINLGPTLKNIN